MAPDGDGLPGITASLRRQPDAVGNAHHCRRGLALAAWRERRERFSRSGESWTEPVAGHFAGLSRVFSAVQGKKGLPLDRYASFLPYRGYFDAVQGPIMDCQGHSAASPSGDGV